MPGPQTRQAEPRPRHARAVPDVAGAPVVAKQPPQSATVNLVDGRPALPTGMAIVGDDAHLVQDTELLWVRRCGGCGGCRGCHRQFESVSDSSHGPLAVASVSRLAMS